MKSKSVWITGLGLWFALTAQVVVAELPAAQIKAAQERWAEEIAKLRAKDEVERHPADAVLFLGSSSVRLWEGIAADMAPYHPIQRGYGGARFADLVVFAEELVKPHRYQAAVVFVGNDVTGKGTDVTVEQVVGWWQGVVKVLRERESKAAIFCVEITPTPLRWPAWERIQAMNRALKAACENESGVHFVETAGTFLDADGLPKEDCFRKDRLHLSEVGYGLWAGLIKEALDGVLK